MKSFQPKAGDRPPDDDPGSPPGLDTTTEVHPGPTETDAMPRPGRLSRNAEVAFRGEQRSNATHASTIDPDARPRFILTMTANTRARLPRLLAGTTRDGVRKRIPAASNDATLKAKILQKETVPIS